MATPRTNQKNGRAKLGRKNQVTLPQEIVDDAGIQTGSEFDITIVKRAKKVPKGSIVLSPNILKRRPWSDEEWRQKEKEVDESLARGETYGPFDTAAEAIKFLRKQSKPRRSKN